MSLLQSSCMKILDSDCFSLTERRVRLYSRGVTVTRRGLCGVCNKEPFVNDVTQAFQAIFSPARLNYQARDNMMSFINCPPELVMV